MAFLLLAGLNGRSAGVSAAHDSASRVRAPVTGASALIAVSMPCALVALPDPLAETGV